MRGRRPSVGGAEVEVISAIGAAALLTATALAIGGFVLEFILLALSRSPVTTSQPRFKQGGRFKQGDRANVIHFEPPSESTESPDLREKAA